MLSLQIDSWRLHSSFTNRIMEIYCTFKKQKKENSMGKKFSSERNENSKAMQMHWEAKDKNQKRISLFLAEEIWRKNWKKWAKNYLNEFDWTQMCWFSEKFHIILLKDIKK